MRSISRPGVATTMSTPRSRARSCGVYDMPPATRITDRSTIGAAGSSASVTCMASSRVGTSTMPRGAVPPAAGEPGDHRQAEGERLAGPGLAAAEDVAPGQGVRDGRGLDRERRGDALGVEGAGQSRRHRGSAKSPTARAGAGAGTRGSSAGVRRAAGTSGRSSRTGARGWSRGRHGVLEPGPLGAVGGGTDRGRVAGSAPVGCGGRDRVRCGSVSGAAGTPPPASRRLARARPLGGGPALLGRAVGLGALEGMAVLGSGLPARRRLATGRRADVLRPISQSGRRASSRPAGQWRAVGPRTKSPRERTGLQARVSGVRAEASHDPSARTRGHEIVQHLVEHARGARSCPVAAVGRPRASAPRQQLDDPLGVLDRGDHVVLAADHGASRSRARVSSAAYSSSSAKLG